MGIKRNKLITIHFIILISIFLLLTFPLIIKTDLDIPNSFDETVFHYPTIKSFANQYPKLDLSNYKSGPTPLYYILMMFFVKVFVCGIIPLRIINLFISVICLMVFFWYLSKKRDLTKALMISFCFALSPYFLGPSIRLATDNMGLLFMFLAMMEFDSKKVISMQRFSGANIFSTLTVLTRQINLWLVGLGLFSSLRYENEPFGLRLKKIILLLIPLLSLLPFFLMWKGLTPPFVQARQQYRALVNLDVIAYSISVLGFYGGFFLPWYLRYFKENSGKLRHVLMILLLSFLFLFIHPVSYSHDAGRWGGVLWSASLYTPNFLSTSLIFWILFPLGCFFFYTIVLSRKTNKDYFIIVSAVLWLIANLHDGLVFERYYSPFLLFFIGYSIKEEKTEPLYYWIGPAVLILCFFVVDLFRFFF